MRNKIPSKEKRLLQQGEEVFIVVSECFDKELIRTLNGYKA